MAFDILEVSIELISALKAPLEKLRQYDRELHDQAKDATNRIALTSSDHASGQAKTASTYCESPPVPSTRSRLPCEPPKHGAISATQTCSNRSCSSTASQPCCGARPIDSSIAAAGSQPAAAPRSPS
jgi:hypothetical protein